MPRSEKECLKEKRNSHNDERCQKACAIFHIYYNRYIIIIYLSRGGSGCQVKVRLQVNPPTQETPHSAGLCWKGVSGWIQKNILSVHPHHVLEGVILDGVDNWAGDH